MLKLTFREIQNYKLSSPRLPTISRTIVVYEVVKHFPSRRSVPGLPSLTKSRFKGEHKQLLPSTCRILLSKHMLSHFINKSQHSRVKSSKGRSMLSHELLPKPLFLFLLDVARAQFYSCIEISNTDRQAINNTKTTNMKP